jgi:hypothetical protein
MKRHLAVVERTLLNMQNKIREHQEGGLTKEELYVELVNRMYKITLWLQDYKATGETE